MRNFLLVTVPLGPWLVGSMLQHVWILSEWVLIIAVSYLVLTKISALFTLFGKHRRTAATCSLPFVLVRVSGLVGHKPANFLHAVGFRIVFLAVLSLSVAGSEHSWAGDGLTTLKSDLRPLRSATHIVLMIVPFPTFFQAPVDANGLSLSSCTYDIASGSGAFDEVLEIIGSGITEYRDGEYSDREKRLIDLREGIVFKRAGMILREFYLEDWGGQKDVRGYSADRQSLGYRQLLGSGNLPERLRILLKRPDVILNVVLSKGFRSNCPHAQ